MDFLRRWGSLGNINSKRKRINLTIGIIWNCVTRIWFGRRGVLLGSSTPRRGRGVLPYYSPLVQLLSSSLGERRGARRRRSRGAVKEGISSSLMLRLNRLCSFRSNFTAFRLRDRSWGLGRVGLWAGGRASWVTNWSRGLHDKALHLRIEFKTNKLK